MKFKKTFCLAIYWIVFFASCTTSPTYKASTLPSGKLVRIMGIRQINFSQGAPALMLQYQTDLKVSDKAALRAEVDEIWPVFKNDVEHANLKDAIINANEVPQGFIIKKSNSYNFVYEKQPDGTWNCLDDTSAK